MDDRTIVKVLAKKHKDFVASIDDPVVAKLVENNSIITGGAIVSMLLGEEVHDFDYYFTNKDTTIAVAEYFVKKFNKANAEKSAEVKVKDDRVEVFIQSIGVAKEDDSEWPDEHGLGQVQDEDGLDDILVQGEKEVADDVVSEKPRYRPVYLSSNAITLSDKIQLVIRFYGEADEIHSNYDFVHCTCYWTSKDKKLVTSVAALRAILAKKLIYTGSKYPLASIMRMRKFIQRGWSINAGQILKMVLQCNALDLYNIEVLREQLTGVDSAYFRQVIDEMARRSEENGELKLTENYLFEIINRIF